MPLTRNFKDTIRARGSRDPKFRKELLREGITAMPDGNVATAKIILRGPEGNPRAESLLGVVGFLQRHAGVRFSRRTELR